MIVNALRQRSQLLANLANGDTGAIGESYRRLSDRYDSLADRIRDGGPLAQRAYYGARVPLREANDRRHDRKEGS